MPPFAAEAHTVADGTPTQIRESLTHLSQTVDADYRPLIDRVLAFAAQAEQQIAEQSERIDYLETLSTTDELTGLLNRRGFRDVLDHALANAKRFGESGLLAYMDLNGFKTINDRYGHDAGDEVLKTVAEVLSSNLRTTDYVARLGGDEFAILFVRSHPAGAYARASELKNMIAKSRTVYGDASLKIGVSVGVAAYGSGTDAQALLSRADADMYRDKRGVAAA